MGREASVVLARGQPSRLVGEANLPYVGVQEFPQFQAGPSVPVPPSARTGLPLHASPRLVGTNDGAARVGW